MKCPKCGFENREGVKFCEECGQVLPVPTAAPVGKPQPRKSKGGRACPSCGHAAKPGVKFCEQCGAALTEEATVESSLTCTSCGHANPPGSRYCEQCGNRLQAAKHRPHPSRRARAWATAGIVLLALGLVAGAAAVVINVIPPITSGEAVEIASARIQTDYPGIGSVSPVVETSRSGGDLIYRIEYQTETGEVIYVMNAETGETLLLGVR